MQKYLALLCLKKNWCAPWEVLSEEAVSPTVPFMRVLEGERRQRFLKLALGKVVRTNYYLIFDSDVLCTRKTTVADLFVGEFSSSYFE